MSEADVTTSSLDGQVAIVTGAAQGLGRGIAEELAGRGATVTIADRQEKKGREVASRLAAQGSRVEFRGLDISKSQSVDACLDAVVSAHGKLDILVNNAGVGQDVMPIVDLPDEEWDRVIDVTLTGTFYSCRAAGRVMERQESGCIVNIASVNGQNPAALVAAYNVAKAGVINLTRTLALELAAYGVRVNAVSPGPVYTDFNRTVMEQRSESLGITEADMIEKVRGAIPLGRWGEAGDIAKVVAFLCGSDAAWMTGEVVRVSGGLEGVSAAPPRRSRAP